MTRYTTRNRTLLSCAIIAQFLSSESFAVFGPYGEDTENNAPKQATSAPSDAKSLSAPSTPPSSRKTTSKASPLRPQNARVDAPVDPRKLIKDYLEASASDDDSGIDHSLSHSPLQHIAANTSLAVSHQHTASSLEDDLDFLSSGSSLSASPTQPLATSTPAAPHRRHVAASHSSVDFVSEASITTQLHGLISFFYNHGFDAPHNLINSGMSLTQKALIYVLMFNMDEYGITSLQTLVTLSNHPHIQQSFLNAFGAELNALPEIQDELNAMLQLPTNLLAQLALGDVAAVPFADEDDATSFEYDADNEEELEYVHAPDSIYDTLTSNSIQNMASGFSDLMQAIQAVMTLVHIQNPEPTRLTPPPFARSSLMSRIGGLFNF